MGQAALAHLRALNAAAVNVVELERALTEAFVQHPDAAILTSSLSVNGRSVPSLRTIIRLSTSSPGWARRTATMPWR